jgi:hypothetical protein
MRKSKHKSIKCSTKAGSVKTRRKCEIEFTLPAFCKNRTNTCNAYHESSNYDMIIGRNLFHSLGINLRFDTEGITWNNAKIQMSPPERINANWIEEVEQLLFAHDRTTTYAESIQSIKEAKYCPADLNKIVTECNHLTIGEQRHLLKSLQKFEGLCDKTLETW